MGKRVLVFIAKSGFDLSELYNPDGLTIYRKEPGGTFARDSKAIEGDLLLLEYVGGTVWKVIRRIKYPYSGNQYDFLIHGGGFGSGSEPTANKPIIVGDDDELSIGIRTGGPDFGIGANPGLGKDWLFWIIIGLIAYKTISK